jgi:hypothetical protein
MADLSTTLELDGLADRFLEPGEIDVDRVTSEDQRRRRVDAGRIGDESRLDARALVADRDRSTRQRATLLVAHDAADDRAIGTLREEGTGEEDAQKHRRGKHAGSREAGPWHT